MFSRFLSLLAGCLLALPAAAQNPQQMQAQRQQQMQQQMQQRNQMYEQQRQHIQQQQLWGQLEYDRQRANEAALSNASSAEAWLRQQSVKTDPRNFRAMLGALAMDLDGTAYGTYIEPIDLNAKDQFAKSTAPKAIALCEKRHPGGGCRLITEFNYGCVWIFWNKRLLQSFWAKHESRVAQVRAQEWCELNGDEKQCREVDWQCAVGEGGDSPLKPAGFSGVIPNQEELEARSRWAKLPVYGAIAIDRWSKRMSVTSKNHTPMEAIQKLLRDNPKGNVWMVTRYHDTCPGLATAKTTKEEGSSLGNDNVFLAFAPTGVEAHNGVLRKCEAASGGAGKCIIWNSYREDNWCSGVDLD